MSNLLGGGPSADVPSPAEQREASLNEKKTERASIRNQALRAQRRTGSRNLLNPGLGIPGMTTQGGSS